MKTFTIRATASIAIAGVIYTADLASEFEVEHSGQIVEHYETLVATAYRCLQITNANMPKHPVNSAGLSNAGGQANKPAPEHTGGTQSYPIDAVRVSFDKKGHRELALVGGPYQKYGVTLYPEKWAWLNEYYPDGFDPNTLAAGDYPTQTPCKMVVTKTTEGKITLNGVVTSA